MRSAAAPSSSGVSSGCSRSRRAASMTTAACPTETCLVSTLSTLYPLPAAAMRALWKDAVVLAE